MPIISIIVPVYNSEPHIKDCLDSILSQTFVDFELIIIDDGSTDQSSYICDEYSKLDPRILVFHKKNEGVSIARNLGLEKASGQYIAFCDSDDIVSPQWIEYMYNAIMMSDIDLIICNYSINEPLKNAQNTIDYGIFERKNLWEIYKKNLLNFPCNKLYRHSIIRENSIQFPCDMSIGEDLYFNLLYFEAINSKICILYNKLYLYHIFENSLSHKYISDYIPQQEKLMDKLLSVMQTFTAVTEDIEREYYNKWIWIIVNALHNNEKNLFSSKKELYGTNQAILDSEICHTAFCKGDFRAYIFPHKIVLKTKNYKMILCYEKIVRFYETIKLKIIHLLRNRDKLDKTRQYNIPKA